MIVSHTCLVLGSVGRRGGAERTRARHQTNNFLIDLGTQMTKGLCQSAQLETMSVNHEVCP